MNVLKIDLLDLYLAGLELFILIASTTVCRGKVGSTVEWAKLLAPLKIVALFQ